MRIKMEMIVFLRRTKFRAGQKWKEMVNNWIFLFKVLITRNIYAEIM